MILSSKQLLHSTNATQVGDQEKARSVTGGRAETMSTRLEVIAIGIEVADKIRLERISTLELKTSSTCRSYELVVLEASAILEEFSGVTLFRTSQSAAKDAHSGAEAG